MGLTHVIGYYAGTREGIHTNVRLHACAHGVPALCQGGIDY